MESDSLPGRRREEQDKVVVVLGGTCPSRVTSGRNNFTIWSQKLKKNFI